MPSSLLGAARRTLTEVVIVLAAALACTAHAARGNALYAEGRYIEAADVFERTEYRLSETDPDEQAEYGLYRGLTLLELGDLGHARQWLAFAQQIDSRAHGTLDEEQRDLLRAAWAKLENVATEEPRPADDRAIAATVAESLPPATRGGNGRRFVPSGESVAH